MVSYKQYLRTAALIKDEQDMQRFIDDSDYMLLLSCRLSLDDDIAAGMATEVELEAISEVDVRLKSIITPEQFEEMEWQMPEIKKWWG